jgi:hypothetical protein
MIQPHINHLAVIVSAVILWILGAAWFSPPLFAKPWMEMLGLKKDDGKKSMMYLGMIGSLVGDLVLSFVLAHVISWSGVVTFGMGSLIGCLVWIGFFASPNLPQGIYEGRRFKLFAITNGYWLLGLFIVGGLLAVWK